MRSALLIQPKVSIVLCLFFCVVYGFSFLIFALTRMPLWLHFLLSAFLLMHFIYIIRRYVFYRHRLSVRRLWYDSQDLWKIQCCDAHVRSGELLQSILISRYFIFLAFRVPGRFFPIALPLALDSADPETMRLLRQVIIAAEL